MGKSTISMAIFHSYVSLPEGKYEWKNNDQPVDGMFFFPQSRIFR